MCADSTRADGPARLQGRVERRLLNQGSKSEHEAVVLVTDQGAVLKLRRIGGNPFRDAVLDGLVGRQIEVTGRREDSTLYFEQWTVLD